jgi:phosphoadenosine phosphosulfate reductase
MTAVAQATALSGKIARLSAALGAIAIEHAPAALSSSLAVEDMVITDAILRNGHAIEIFTLDTGRLHAETLGVLPRVREQYGYEIRIYRPDADAVAGYVDRFGLDAFYESIELRQRCCQIRKVEPLKRALADKNAWVTGMRRAQSVTRRDLPESEYDAQYGLWKFNPLADWNEAEVWQYIRQFEVPYNPLQDQGYRSIGCAPCTRATAAGEDLRAGRWWWEDPESKECGLHKRPTAPDANQQRNAT